MADLVLHDREQAAVRAIIASEPGPDGALPGEAVFRHIARLIEYDAIGIAVLDRVGSARGEVAGQAMANGDSVASGAPVLGIQEIDGIGAQVGSRTGRGVAVLTFGVGNGPHHIVQLWMVRRTTRFTDRDRALLGLVAPALERVLRVRPTTAFPGSLTAQERRVLLHVAEGLSNAEIADRLVVAQSTVRKHLEHSYRKLGVTNRLAAMYALQGRRGAESGSEIRVEAFA
jgi:DNA-binding CsgD family transcriptional regulator